MCSKGNVMNVETPIGPVEIELCNESELSTGRPTHGRSVGDEGRPLSCPAQGIDSVDPALTFEEASSRVERALARLRRGGMVLVLDDPARENEGDLIIPASRVSAEQMAFILKHGTGFVCVALDDQRADELDLPLISSVLENEESQGTAFTVPVDHAACDRLGVSASDRAITARLLARECATAADFTRPGAIFPLRARSGGVLERSGHTEAAMDLARLSGHAAAAVLSEVMGPDGRMMRPTQLTQFAAEHDLPMLYITDLILYRRRNDSIVQRMTETLLPTDYGQFRLLAYRSRADGIDHLALTIGKISQRMLVRVHSECLTGDVLGSRRCDCGPQLRRSMEAIPVAGAGVIVYLRGHEGRGIGLGDKLRAYALQDAGLDTVDANSSLGLPVDSRDYGVGAAILEDIGVSEIRLLTNNPLKITGLSEYGLKIVERVPVLVDITPDNERYLRAKMTRLRHELPDDFGLLVPDAPGQAS